MISGRRASRYARLRQRWVDRAARRIYERLAASPESYRSAPSTVLATGLALLILTFVVAVLAVLVWGTFHASGMMWVPVALGWLMVVALRPRLNRLPADAIVLDETEYPGVHALVRAMADAVGVRAPRVVAVDVDFNGYVTSVGWRGRPAMVLGLPLMTLLSWHARLGLIGHELGHLRGKDTVRGRAIAMAANAMAGVHYLMSPSEEDLYMAWEPEMAGVGGFSAVIGRAMQVALASPFLLLSLLLERLTLTSRQYEEYLADRRAAEVVGSDACVEFLSLDLKAVVTTAAAAARRGEDPYAYLDARPAPTSSERAARMVELAVLPHRADSTHPRDDLRIKLLQADPRPPGTSAPNEVACLRAEQELATLRADSRKELSQVLRFGPYN